jgi:MoxR-like ATPase
MVGTTFIDESDVEKKAMAILRVSGNLRLIGETGVGKSTLVHYLSEKHKWELYEFALSTDTSRWELLAQDYLTAKQGATATVQRTGPVVDWLTVPEGRDPKKPQVLFLDEFNYARPSVLTILNMITDFRRSLYVPELKNSPILERLGLTEPKLRRTEKHYIIIGMNPAERAGYAGTFSMNIAQLRRFESLELGYLSQQAESRRLETETKCSHEQAMKYVAMAGQTRALYRVGRLSTPITTGNLINYAKLEVQEKLKDPEIAEIMGAMYLQTERDTVNALWKGKTSAEQIMKEEETMQD